MVIMFERVGLHTNLIKTKSMVCTPWLICDQQGVEAYKRRSTGEGTTFRESKITKLSCEECVWGQCQCPPFGTIWRGHMV